MQKNRIKKSKEKKQNTTRFSDVRFHPEIQVGLLSSQVASREQDGLTNKTKKHYSKSYGEILKDNLVSLFNILLFVIALALIIVRAFDQLMFLVVLFFNIAIGIYQEVRAKHTIDRLRLVTAPNAEVIRDAQQIAISSDKIVLDDILVLSSGKQISADAIVRSGVVEVNESLLTGEAIAVKKKAGDMVYAGSYVTSGSAIVQVEKVGDDNYAQQLQKKAKVLDKPKSELLRSLNFIFHIISFIIIPLGIIMAIGNFIQLKGNEELTTFVKAEKIVSSTAGSLVGMIPSGMFLLTSMTLYTGVYRLGKKKTSVQELYSIEMLARVDTLCLDKTGTITDGTMKVEDTIVFDEYKGIDLDTIMGSYLRAVNDNNQTAMAMKEKYPWNNILTPITVLPFSSERKYSAVTFQNKGTFVFGAPEFVYKGKDREIQKAIRFYISKGTRVLMLAHSKDKIKGDKVPEEVSPICLFVLYDHIRDDAYETISWFRKNDVAVKIISGDNPIAVAEIAKAVGIDTAHQYISLEGMSLEEVANVANDYTVFGRVTPEQKAALVTSLRKHKRTVAMIGDGVNDILSLKQADCSIAMASGSEAACNVAHLVLLDSNFNVLPDVVSEGRRAISNLQNVSSLFLTKTIFSIFFSIIWAVVMFADWRSNTSNNYPFQTTNFYIWEMLAIGLSSFFLALQPNKKRIKGDFVSNVVRKALPGGLAITLGVSAFFVFENWNNGAGLFQFQVVGEGVTHSSAVITCSSLIMYIIAFIVLLRICIPFNRYRAIVCASSIALAILALILSETIIPFKDGMSFFGLSIHTLSGASVKGFFIVLVFTIGIYFLFDFVMKNLEIHRK